MTTNFFFLSALAFVALLIVIFIVYRLTLDLIISWHKQRAIFQIQKVPEKTLSLRLQALERLVIFLERIKLPGLVRRTLGEGLTVAELQFSLIETIRTELDHNISQQIYVSSECWNDISATVEREIALINQIATEFSHEARAVDFAKKLLIAGVEEGLEGGLHQAIEQLRSQASSIWEG